MAEPYCEGYLAFLWLFELCSSKLSVPCRGTEGCSVIWNAWGQILQCNSTAERAVKPWKLCGTGAARCCSPLGCGEECGEQREMSACWCTVLCQDTLLGVFPWAVLEVLKHETPAFVGCSQALLMGSSVSLGVWPSSESISAGIFGRMETGRHVVCTKREVRNWCIVVARRQVAAICCNSLVYNY